MTFATALKRAIAKREACPSTDGETIDFKDPKTVNMVRDILLETLRDAGYIPLWIMVARAWKVQETVKV